MEDHQSLVAAIESGNIEAITDMLWQSPGQRTCGPLISALQGRQTAVVTAAARHDRRVREATITTLQGQGADWTLELITSRTTPVATISLAIVAFPEHSKMASCGLNSLESRTRAELKNALVIWAMESIRDHVESPGLAPRAEALKQLVQRIIRGN